MAEENKAVSLSWLVISARDYKPESDWIWDVWHQSCYGILKKDRTESLKADLANHYSRVSNTEDYYGHCVLMPELPGFSIEDAASCLREWCNQNDIPYLEDLDHYKKVEAFYWGYDDIAVNQVSQENDPSKSSEYYYFPVD